MLRIRIMLGRQDNFMQLVRFTSDEVLVFSTIRILPASFCMPSALKKHYSVHTLVFNFSLPKFCLFNNTTLVPTTNINNLLS